MRCEDYVRHGGMMTFGRPIWKQCKNEATVLVTARNKGEKPKTTLPLCNECFKRARGEGDMPSMVAEIIRKKLINLFRLLGRYVKKIRPSGRKY
jgi:hypothetical protein